MIRAGRFSSGRAARGRCEGSVAIGLAVAVSLVLVVTVTAVVQLSVVSQGAVTGHLGQTQALDAAEAGLNGAYAKIQQVSPSSLPCGNGVISNTFGTAPVNASYSVSVSYFDTFPPTDAALACSAVWAQNPVAQSAEVIATGSSSGVSSYMEGLVKLSLAVSQANVFNYAIYSQDTLTGSGNSNIGDANQSDANLYTNGGFDCQNSDNIYGSVVTLGTESSGYGFDGTGNCQVYGNLTAVHNINLANSAGVNGNVTSTSGTLALSGGVHVKSNAVAAGTISYAYGGCSSFVSGTCSANDASPAPAAETLPTFAEPVIPGNSTWSNFGYTNQVTNNDCGSDAGSVYNAIANMSTASAPTLIETTCALSWTNAHTITLAQNLAIFSTCGYSMANKTIWQSSSSTVRDLFIIVPTTNSSGTAQSCSGGGGYAANGTIACSSSTNAGAPGITLQNQTQFDSTETTSTPVDVLLYTPCTLDMSNNTTLDGQIYGGTVNFGNYFTVGFSPVPTPPGTAGGGAGSGPTTTSVGVVYERQITSQVWQ